MNDLTILGVTNTLLEAFRVSLNAMISSFEELLSRVKDYPNKGFYDLVAKIIGINQQVFDP